MVVVVFCWVCSDAEIARLKEDFTSLHGQFSEVVSTRDMLEAGMNEKDRRMEDLVKQIEVLEEVRNKFLASL